MICGLSPVLISDITKRISSIVNDDEYILHRRRNETSRRTDMSVTIQRLMVNCLKECGSDDKIMITLSDLYTDDFEPFPPLRIIIPKGVISMTLKGCRSASYFTSLSSVLQKEHLRHLTLAHIECYHSGGHKIDLSRQNYLQTLTLVKCPDVVITGLNTEQLEKLCINNNVHNYINTLNINLISQANKLNELHLHYLSGNISSLVSLIQHTTLKELTLIGVSDGQCNIEGHMKGVHDDQCYVKGHLRGLSDDQSDVEGHMKGVSSDQSGVEGNIKGVLYDESDVEGHMRGMSDDRTDVKGQLKGVSDGQPDVEGHMRGFSDVQSTVEGVMKSVFNNQPDAEAHMHVIDLSKQNKLQKLQLYDCKNMTIFNLNTEQLEYLHISDGVLDFDLFKNANRLTDLYLHGNISCQLGYQFKYNEKLNDIVHTLHQLFRLRLENVDIGSNALTVIPKMNCLRAIELYYINMSLDTWCTFVDSLLTLQQYVEVVAIPTNEEQRNYVRINSKFEVMKEERL